MALPGKLPPRPTITIALDNTSRTTDYTLICPAQVKRVADPPEPPHQNRYLTTTV